MSVVNLDAEVIFMLESIIWIRDMTLFVIED